MDSRPFDRWWSALLLPATFALLVSALTMSRHGWSGVSDEQVEAKFRSLAGDVMASREIEALISAVRGLESPAAVEGLSGALRNSARALAA